MPRVITGRRPCLPRPHVRRLGRVLQQTRVTSCGPHAPSARQHPPELRTCGTRVTWVSPGLAGLGSEGTPGPEMPLSGTPGALCPRWETAPSGDFQSAFHSVVPPPRPKHREERRFQKTKKIRVRAAGPSSPAEGLARGGGSGGEQGGVGVVTAGRKGAPPGGRGQPSQASVTLSRH